MFDRFRPDESGKKKRGRRYAVGGIDAAATHGPQQQYADQPDPYPRPFQSMVIIKPVRPGAMWNSIRRVLLGWLVSAALGLTATRAEVAASSAPAALAETARTRAERVYQAAAAAYAQAPTDVALAWQLGRASFDFTELARDDAERAALAQRGIAVCRAALARETNIAAVPYYLGMNLGQLARTKSLGALPLVREMETLFLHARQLDERFDEAGPDRNLGLLYLEAPGWPVSVGHRGKARQHLKRALELAPHYPENHLNLLEACLRWGEKDLTEGTQRLAQLLPVARQRYSGEVWAWTWVDWDRRWRALQAKTTEPDTP